MQGKVVRISDLIKIMPLRTEQVSGTMCFGPPRPHKQRAFRRVFYFLPANLPVIPAWQVIQLSFVWLDPAHSPEHPTKGITPHGSAQDV
jgi:hypothetical protein